MSAPNSSKKKPFLMWWVIAVGLLHLWQGIGLLSSRQLMMAWSSTPFFTLRLSFAIVWTVVWGWLAGQMWFQKPQLHLKTATIIITYTLYQVGVVFLSQTSLGRDVWISALVLGLVALVVSYWFLRPLSDTSSNGR